MFAHNFVSSVVAIVFALSAAALSAPQVNSKRDTIDCTDPRGPNSFLPHVYSASIANNGTQVTDSVAVDGSIVRPVLRPLAHGNLDCGLAI